ncbi:MAG TPA: 4-hydroxy-tetrahydrodipicolinate synthase [Sphingobacteriaceae bacterium]|nr:4-hydroxy-tetrahydrodipicolinate synthase [Sphingobacteriaceae bacterium]
MTEFYGTGVAMVTPFNTDGSVDYDGLKNVINHLIEGGVEYLVSLGTTGESAVLSSAEKKEVWKFTADIVAGRLPLVAGIAGNNTLEVVEQFKNFDIKGYDAILSASPSYNKPAQEGIYQHYKALSAASKLPILLYNVPGRTGSNMSAETTLRLANDFKNIIGIKEASANFEQINTIIRDKPEGFLVISGDDMLALPLIASGAVGVISVVSNALPRIFSDMVRLCLQEDFKEALPLHSSMLEFTGLCFTEGSPGGVKAALKQLGICNDIMRLPLVNVTENIFTKINKELLKLNLVQV